MRIIKKNDTVNDKIIVADLTRINQAIICADHDKSKRELRADEFICTCDGKIYINKKGLFKDILVSIFNIISVAPRCDLEQLQKIYKEKFPEVKTVNDIEKVDYDLRFQALTYLLIPVELGRRDIEKAYYGSK